MRYTIAVDFDGVIHSYTSPWISEHEIPDPPVAGAIEWLKTITKEFDVVVFTTRGRTPEGQKAVVDYLNNYGFLGVVIVTDRKPPALVYIDDRAWRFTGTFPTADEIHKARPWNKQGG